MNKWQIISPLALLTAVGLLVAMVHGRHQHRAYVTAQTRMVGQELIAATNSPRLVNGDRAFTRSLSMFLASPARVSNVQLGDEPPSLRRRHCLQLAEPYQCRRETPAGQARFDPVL